MGFTNTVPTDHYSVTAIYLHSRKSDDVTVSGSIPATRVIAPRFRALVLACNETNATFRVLDLYGDLMQSGPLPATVAGLPTGGYTIEISDGHNRLEKTVLLQAGRTNTYRAEFRYGSAEFKTKLPGGTVFDESGRLQGTTPITIIRPFSKTACKS